MPSARELLESTFQSGRLKKWTIVAFASLFAIMLGFMIVLELLYPQFSLDPFRLPLTIHIFIILMFLLIFNVQGMIFRIYGIRWGKSDSERFLMAQRYRKRGLAIIIIAVIVMLTSIITPPVVNERITSRDHEIVSGSIESDRFLPEDPLAFSRIVTISVTSDLNIPLDIYLMRDEDLKSGLFDNRINAAPRNSQGITHFSREKSLEYGIYAFFIKAPNTSVNAPITFEITRELSVPIMNYLTLFPIAFVVANIAWIIYLIPVIRRYKDTSIYE